MASDEWIDLKYLSIQVKGSETEVGLRSENDVAAARGQILLTTSQIKALYDTYLGSKDKPNGP